MRGLCARCRRLIAQGTVKGMQRARARGARIGRPRVMLSERDLRRVLAGDLTAVEVARRAGCSAMTVRRRVRVLT